MELTIDRNTLYTALALILVLVLLGLATLGRSFTPVTSDGSARLLTWSDWQLSKAEHRFQEERDTLRTDVDDLAVLLNQNPDPVAAQLLVQKVKQHTANGEDALLMARSAVLLAAQDVANWSAGALDRDTAIASLQAATDLLK